ncbi:hypothetical protein SDC9_147551 [bioreactor metagenome]|uniref:Glycoside hydrolase family 2 catalytic domain-containing protein n=1 Tax=bioreactor metagenome TaxID=1076179 RepID=A0A645EF07_9ZZZZ
MSAATERFGFREFTLQEGKFHLNGKRIYLFGESIPVAHFGGFERSAEDERERLYRYLSQFRQRGGNIVRTAHMPAPEEMPNIADEIGIMVYNEYASPPKVIEEKEFQRRND